MRKRTILGNCNLSNSNFNLAKKPSAKLIKSSDPNEPPTHVREGNNYRDRWFVGSILIDHELKRWRDSIDNKENLANVKEACCRILNAYKNNSKKLDLSNLELTSLPAPCISLLQNLKFLNLSKNYLKDVESNGIDKLANLVNLDLSRNQLKEITGLANLHKLTSLNICANLNLIDLRELLVFPDELLHKVITYAIKDSASLRTGELFALPRIAAAIKNRDERLDLSFTGLWNVSPYIQLVRNLKDLNLSRNEFNSLDGIEFASPSLRTLKLSKCGLTTLNWVKPLTNLTDIDVRYNKLTRVNDGLARLPNLKKFSSKGNKLQEIPIVTCSRKSNPLFCPTKRPLKYSSNPIQESALTASMNSISSSSEMSLAECNPLDNLNCQSIFSLFGAPYNGLRY